MLSLKVKNIFKLLLANILVFLTAVIVIEVGGQVYAYFHPAYKVFPFVPHPILGWRFIPNSDHIVTGDYWHAREFSAEVKINSHGFRDFERPIEKNKNTVRVALLGDSMVSARQVDFEKTAGQLLEKRLNKEFGAKIEESFINGSMNAQIFYKILFGEDVGKYIIITNNEKKVRKIAEKNKINLFKIGTTKRNYLNINNQTIKLNELKNNFENNFFNCINN